MRIIYELHEEEPDLITLSGSDLDFKNLKKNLECEAVILNQEHTILNKDTVLFSKTDTVEILLIIDEFIKGSEPCHNYFYSRETGIDFMFSQNEYE